MTMVTVACCDCWTCTCRWWRLWHCLLPAAPRACHSVLRSLHLQVFLVGGFSAAPYLQQRIRDGISNADYLPDYLGKAPEVVVVQAPYAAVLQGEGL